MKVKDGKLDPSDAYESQWVGYDGDKQPTRIGGDGTPVVGIVGRGSDREVNGFGLLFKGQEQFDLNAPTSDQRVNVVPIGAIPHIVAGGGAPVFKESAPEGGLLIGLEIIVGKFGPHDVIKAIRPIYRVKGKEQFGAQRGTAPAEAITIKAKEGYAVGALTCKSGLNFDGCSLTFMKVKDGKLDPSDAYESDWVGYSGNKRPTRIGGDGTLVIGVVGRGSERQVNGFGLLFKGQEAFDPERGR
jgi:hypothetical protein